MIFDESLITNSGRLLLTRATSGTKLIWSRCGCFDDSSASQSSYNLQNPVALGNAVASFNEGGGVTAVSCSMTNVAEGCSDGDALAFGLWAKIEGDREETLVLVSRVTTSQPTHFPAYDGTARTKLSALIDFSIALAEGVLTSISVSLAQYALASDLQHEIETREDHEQNFVNLSETQVIDGEKIFNADVHVGRILSDSYSCVGTPDDHFDEIYADEIHGEMFGDVTGNLTGNVTGNVTGNLTGDVIGNLTGDVTGCIPKPSRGSSVVSVPYGAIVVAYGVTATTGSTITISPNSVYEGSLSNESGVNYISSGTYVALSLGTPLISTLLMRIS